MNECKASAPIRGAACSSFMPLGGGSESYEDSALQFLYCVRIGVKGTFLMEMNNGNEEK